MTNHISLNILQTIRCVFNAECYYNIFYKYETLKYIINIILTYISVKSNTDQSRVLKYNILYCICF